MKRVVILEMRKKMKWEYKSIFIMGDSFGHSEVRNQNTFDQLGLQEWELVSCCSTATAFEFFLIFKRPITNLLYEEKKFTGNGNASLQVTQTLVVDSPSKDLAS